jgi:hypothetical protein
MGVTSMPSLSDSIGADLSNYGTVPTSGSGPQVANSMSNSQPGLTGLTVSPLPILTNSSPDNLRTYYQGTAAPQTRLLNPAPVTPQNITNVTNVTQVTNTTVAAPTTAGFTTGTNSSGTFVKNPVGQIDQWGTGTAASQTARTIIPFALPFTNLSSINIQITPITDGVDTDAIGFINVVGGAITLTTFGALAGVTHPQNFNWRATGF